MVTGAKLSKKALKGAGVSLTPALVLLLLDHAQGARPTRAAIGELRLLQSLRARKLIRFNRPMRPTHTIATVRGREVLTALLAMREDTSAPQSVEDSCE